MYKLIVAGSRNINNADFIYKVLDNFIENPAGTEIVCGGAKGVDSIGKMYAKRHAISYSLWIADWNKHGNGAGIRRNKEMGNYADGLIAFWNGESKGTKHMIDYMAQLKKPIVVIYYYE